MYSPQSSPNSAADCPTADCDRAHLNPALKQFRTWLQSVWQRCFWLLSANPEPRVWQEFDRHGQPLVWHVYDPSSGHAQTFGSELEIRLWLEQQYLR